MEETALLKMVVEDLNAKFMKRFDNRMHVVWNEAKGRSIDDKHIDEALKRYCYGHDKYFLAQSVFLNLGREFGYETKIVRCKQNNYPIPVMTIGKFSFTAHHSFLPDPKFVQNSSLTRQQHSAVNNNLLNQGQGSLFAENNFDDSKILAADNIQANILFGCGGNGLDFENHGFLRIAFPSVERYVNRKGDVTDKVWLLENYDFRKVLELVSAKEQRKERKPIIDVAVPKIKIVKGAQ